MNKLFLVKMAYRNFTIHKMRTILTLLGVTIGISAIIFLVSFGFGIERLVTKEITGGDAFKLIDVGTGNSQVVKLNDESVEKIRRLSGTKDIETTINIGAKAKYNNTVADIALYGTTAKYSEWSGLTASVGANISDKNSNTIVVNTAFVNFIKVTKPQDAVGKKVTLDLILPEELIEKETNKTITDREYVIIGVTKNDAPASAYLNREILKEMGVVNYSQAKIEMDSRSKEKELRSAIENLGFKTQYVGDTVSQIQQIFSIFTVILSSFGLIALIVASLGMFNTLTISLMERMKEVALMKILGIKKRDILRIFITESVVFGIIGGILGILFGVLIGKIANSVFNHYAVQAGASKVNVFYLPFWFIATIFVFAVLLGYITGLYPSRRATKVEPLDVMRFE